jgi:hypothetical protein
MTILNIGLSSWAVDLKDVGAIYPFQGFEVPMVIVAVVFWVLWHVWQISHENAELRAKSSHADTQKTKSAIDRY